MSPTPSRRHEISDTPRGSITSIEEGVVNTSVAATPLTFSFDPQLAGALNLGHVSVPHHLSTSGQSSVEVIT